MDILKVGEGLGIGSIGRYAGAKVLHFNKVDSTFVDVENSLKNSAINVNYYGWKTLNDKVDLTSKLSIAPNQRFTKHTIQLSKSISGICTGIVKHDVEFIQKMSENQEWGYIATYGKQTLVPDNLGMAIFYEAETVEDIIDSEFDHLIVFKPSTEKISFYFLGAWEKEKGGIKTKEDFLSYLDEKLEELNDNNKI
jgi:hypothetical protein